MLNENKVNELIKDFITETLMIDNNEDYDIHDNQNHQYNNAE